MGKIGRNERCPCGSGKKYKHCCAHRRQPLAPPAQGLLQRAVEVVCQAARLKKRAINELGVFILWATERGNAWLFEVTQADCVQLAKEGEPLSPSIEENPETIEVEWSHTFRVVDNKMVLTAYVDQQERILTDCPVREVSAAIKRVAEKFPPEVRAQLHIDPEQAAQG